MKSKSIFVSYTYKKIYFIPLEKNPGYDRNIFIISLTLSFAAQLQRSTHPTKSNHQQTIITTKTGNLNRRFAQKSCETPTSKSSEPSLTQSQGIFIISLCELTTRNYMVGRACPSAYL